MPHKLSSAQVYGVDSNGYVVTNGNAINITSNGFYRIYTTLSIYPNTSMVAENISPQIWFDIYSSLVTASSVTYNATTNKFSVNINGVTSSNFSGLKINLPK
ncbi:hypothetical protein [Chryseobacterium indoltheticum]|uniref:hypothetical protein n=1 Tax=Chryseobacterium indoltheticum TaxID=254 RepID=UPI003F497304